ncbi:hypothetical protein DUK53_14485 [Listeria sp. SHR_NRA_18]|uniref:hypothetical protein n=1 Tax=Listeria TaxID=1637 RepID=UPI000F600EF5|nr:MULTISPECIES: hypothetical protein [Listeria]RQW65818.1 hypothetical protein DUK53_14485 [Listeria sp. SHR_NRA_18]WAO22060.1 hypothetical protein OTR81_01840 [Listeria newyorkensis]
MTQNNTYKNELYKKLKEKVRYGDNITRQDLSNALWLYEKTLKERENAEVIYRDSRAHSEFWTEDEIRGYKNHMKFTKGIWIPDVDGEENK